MKATVIEFTKSVHPVKLPLAESSISAGFPSPADDFVQNKLDLNDLLIKHPAATFFVRVSGESMMDAGIFTNDVLIVDRSIEAINGSIIVAVLDGEMTVKRFKKINNTIMLFAENKAYKPIEVAPDRDFSIWGVVVYVIHKP